ncbi:hypothetical protein Dsin_003171 [Dipteronia sinensis]|uniref:Cytochrome P450 n=1 Tax=Dipteronia sinensis TaxID=43782 RepID=A0AAE0B8M7_9ROSI|nr:hypothetical protein Dsin_003171 [Dipteronia sinensis]
MQVEITSEKVVITMNALYYLGLLVSILIIVYQFAVQRRIYQHKNLPPSPPSLPIIGHFHLLKRPVHEALTNLSKKYGPIFLLRMGSRPILVLSSRAAIEECFSNNDIIFANRPLLPSKRISQYNYTTRELPMATTGATFEGKKCFEEEELELDKITKGKLDDLKQTFGPSVNMALGDYFPYLRWLTYYGVEKQEIKIHKRRDAFIQALLDTHQNNNRETSRPIIDVLLNLQESEPEFYTNGVVKGIVHAMLIAGTHTTVITLDSVVTQLIAHPEAFKKARDEIDNQVGDSRLLNDADLAKLAFLHGTISETLRLGIVKVLPAHESSEDCTVGGYHIPKGTQLLVNAWAVHSDPELYIEPDRFKPERFRRSEVQEKGGCKFIPFGLGRRVCPGEGLGMRVMALSLGTLIQCFDWEEVKEDQSQVPVKTNPNKAEEGHVKIIFRPREALANVLAHL